ncbi:hypothetical protein SPRG_03745 [Saprolegnia parasitica CBS 223.65]|uniref:FYVE-type domain-containing protein n=1 Tax=Saprolegnia parasitica (strain CBS 223.65) TaxID=695850 RepID=A0A067CRF7_SAPPC|nr:hypothetical protein SPRG_03745 [Saprolegnia parasitica CBS 223.65]KDO31825.1 hypothetical protein SPRG_03745 [Saprolegnia parasitica CBS 223.65]|eukprot:XP_012197704.1 hypothetical protein SPRG_03745 [Saprolegnia parasitica CBS 223.65]
MRRSSVTHVYCALPPPVLARLADRHHWVHPRCHACKASLLLFWKKRNCYMCGEVVCVSCRQHLVIEQHSNNSCTLHVRVCTDCHHTYFNAPERADNRASPPETVPVKPRETASIELPDLSTRRLYQPRTNARPPQRPTRKSAFESPRRQSTTPKKRAWPYHWCPPPMVVHEGQRVRVLHDLRLLDTPPSEIYDVLCALAAKAYACPIAGVTFLDAKRQWFKARVGLKQSEISRDVALCAHAIASTAPLVVLDATLDDRFRQNPLVTGPASFRFLASAPVCVTGHVVGTVMVADTHVRPFCDATDLVQLAQALERILQEHADAMRRPAAPTNGLCASGI